MSSTVLRKQTHNPMELRASKRSKFAGTISHGAVRRVNGIAFVLDRIREGTSKALRCNSRHEERARENHRAPRFSLRESRICISSEHHGLLVMLSACFLPGK